MEVKVDADNSKSKKRSAVEATDVDGELERGGKKGKGDKEVNVVAPATNVEAGLSKQPCEKK